MSQYEVGGMTVENWLNSIGLEARATASRWISKGMITPVNILGRNYITREEDERFWQRAKAGEFEQENNGIIMHQKEEK